MPQFNFKKDFTAPIARGSKTQTIRAMRKRLPKVGELMTMYQGARYSPTKLGEAKITQVGLIDLDCNGVRIQWLDESGGRKGQTEMKPGPHLEMFAKRDGFASFVDLIAFFSKEHKAEMAENNGVFSGFITCWDSFTLYRPEV